MAVVPMDQTGRDGRVERESGIEKKAGSADSADAASAAFLEPCRLLASLLLGERMV